MLAIWFILNGIDLLQDADWIEYSTTEMDRSVEDVLDNFKEAVRSAEDVQKTSVNPIFFNRHLLSPNSMGAVSIQNDRAQRFEKEAKFFLGNFKPHKLNETFLI